MFLERGDLWFYLNVMSSLEFDLVDLKFVVEALLVFSSEIAVDLYLCEFVVSYREFEVVCDGNSR